MPTRTPVGASPSQQSDSGSGWLRQMGAFLLVTYLLVSAGVHHAFPFYVFDMYNAPPKETASRILARLEDGSVHNVDVMDAWSCPEPLNAHPPGHHEQCGIFEPNFARERSALRWIGFHPVTPSTAGSVVSADLIRRVWRVTPEGVAVDRDCVLQHCSVVLGAR